ncbi:YIP1 family protein [Tropicimonas sp.]|uniref:YIP1 family protein n=1 Tax=Tropicimonas sp. TaxID=2067044 RepID=UPI003A8C785A
MSLTREILRTYVAPRRVMRDLLASVGAGDRPDARALACLLGGCLVIFVSAIPFALKGGDPWPAGAPVQMRLANTFFAWMFIAPPVFYLLAALGHLVARLFGGRGSFLGARLALFWTVLAVSPLFLLNGMIAQVIGGSPQHPGPGVLIPVVFLVLWTLSLVEAERPLPS